MLSLKKNRTAWKNWSESVHCQVKQYAEPATLAEVQHLVQNCSQHGKKIRVVGAGHSFTPLVATGDLLLSLDRLSGICHIDHANHVVTVWGGTRLSDLGEQLFAHGFAMENLGDINAQSIAGAISTGTHGTGVTFGNIPTQVTGLSLVTATGELMEISETEHKDLLQAAKVSLGMLGIIVKVQLKVLPAYHLIGNSYRLSLDNCLQELHSLKQRNRNFEFYWFPYTKTVQIKTMNVYEEEIGKQPSKSRQQTFKKLIIENGLFWALSEMSRQFPVSAKAVSTISALGVPIGTEIAPSHQLYATPRFVKFHEMEYCIPEEAAGDVLNDMNHMIQKRKFAVHFPIECRFVKQDDIWLSPSYQRNAAYIAIHMYKGMDFNAYFTAMEEIFRHYHGRPHWGKMHTLTFDQLRELYPRLEDFLRIRAEQDKQGMFVNSYLQQLLNI